MKILYFDVLSLLYSQRYLESQSEGGINCHSRKFVNSSSLIERVSPDLKAAFRLESAARKNGFLLYPLGIQYTAKLFSEQGVFSPDTLAPDMDITGKTYPDDNNPIRRMLVHAASLNAKWYVCGEINSEDLRHHFPERFLIVDNVQLEGVSEDLIARIVDILKCG